jgi:heme O synthase-like polyprenyltransferase
VPLTVLPWLAGTQGLAYVVVALLLGARLLWYCVKLLKEQSATPLAWKMYRYSLVYLALLFVAMGIDKQLPFGHREIPREITLTAPAAPAPGPEHDH